MDDLSSITALPNCPLTGKESFAKKKPPAAKRMYNPRGGFLHNYKCKTCPYWHMSRQH